MSRLRDLYEVIGKPVRIKLDGVTREVEGTLIDVGRNNLMIEPSHKGSEPMIPLKNVQWVKYYEERKIEQPFAAETSHDV